jgi:uncharacterized membrane protein
MAALSNILALVTVPLGAFTIHLIQLPIILAGLAAGPYIGGLVGFVGAFVMAFTLPVPNPYILLGNALLGFLTGLIFSSLHATSVSPHLARVASAMLAYAVQTPYVWVTDIYLMGMPPVVVQAILVKLLLEDAISAVISTMVLSLEPIRAMIGYH